MTQQQIDLAGDGGNAFSFGPQGAQPGAWVQGTITALARVQQTDYQTNQPEFWPDGNPKMQYKVTLQTELRDPANPSDTGLRDLYLDGSAKPRDNGTYGRLAAAVKAVRDVTGGTNLQVGGRLTLQWVSGMGYSGDPRNYTAWYEQPAVQLEQGPPPGTQPPQQPASVQEVINQQSAQGQLPPQWAMPQGQPPQGPPAGGPPASTMASHAHPQSPAAPTQQGAPAGPPSATPPSGIPQQQLPASPPPAGPPPQAPPQAPPQGTPAGQPQHSPEAVAALRAAGIDPATVPVQQ